MFFFGFRRVKNVHTVLLNIYVGTPKIYLGFNALSEIMHSIKIYFILFLYFEIWCNTYMLAYIQCESVFNTGVLLQASYCWVWGCVITWVAYCGRKEEEHRTWQAEAAREFGVWISESLSFLETVYLFNIRPKVKGNNPCLFWFVCLKYFYFSLLFYSRLSESPRVWTVRDIHLHGKWHHWRRS